MPKIKITARVEVKDKNGKTIKVLKKHCKSYVQQMIDMLRSCMNASLDSVTDTADASQAFAKANAFIANASSGTDTFGIVVGTDDTPVVIDQYALIAQIPHGNSPNQLSYGVCGVGTPATVTTTRTFTISRTFTNNSGSSIEIKEVGLYVQLNATYFAMIERSLLDFTIANAQSGTVTYNIYVTV